MKFLHIILPTKRMMETYIQMIRKYYPEEDHVFYFLGKCPKSEKDLFTYGHVFELADGHNKFEKIRNFYRDISDCDYIIWHCLTLSPKFVLFFTIFRHFLKKMIWVMWGIDLYVFNRPVHSIKDKIFNYLNWMLRKSIKYVVAIFPTDIPAYQRIFHKTRLDHIFYAPYPMREKVFFDLENLGIYKQRANGEVWIQVGNNANSFNRHLDILKAIKKFSNERIHVFIPMSYGNDWHNKIPNYIDLVREKAIEYFGEERVTVLKTLMPLDEYSKFLDQMDIIIIATDRQNALGNIEKNMFSGGKVYLSEKNPLYTYFNQQGISIGKFENIEEENFETFAKPLDNRKIKDWMIKTSYPQNNIVYWNRIFQALGYKMALNEAFFEEESSRILKAQKEIRQHANEKIKMNYINLERYTHVNGSARRSRQCATDVVLVGVDSSVKELIYRLDFENHSVGYKWNIMGIINDSMIDVPGLPGGCNVISTLSQFQIGERDKLAIFCDPPYKRKKYYFALRPKEDQLCSLNFNNSYISPKVQWEKEPCICIGTGSQINSGCHLGRLIKVGVQTYIGKNCRIGDFCTIGDHVFIGDGVEIGDEVVIENGLHIISGDTIKMNNRS